MEEAGEESQVGKVRRPRGQIVRGARNGRPQVVCTRDLWNDTAEAIFLETLAATCNVRMACEAAEFSKEAIYRRRLREPGFKARWAEALATGYAQLELALVERATTSMGNGEIRADHPIPPMTASEAMTLLKLHRDNVSGKGPRYNANTRLPDIETVKAQIVRNIRAIQRGRALPNAEMPPSRDDTHG